MDGGGREEDREEGGFACVCKVVGAIYLDSEMDSERDSKKGTRKGG